MGFRSLFLFLAAFKYPSVYCHTGNFSNFKIEIVYESESSNNLSLLSRRLYSKDELQKFKIYTKGELCQGPITAEKFKFSCNNPLKIMVIPQAKIVPTLQGCDKRAYHLVECLIGLGHKVSIIPFSRTQLKPGVSDIALLSALDASFNDNIILQKADVKGYFKRQLVKEKPDVIIMWLWFWDAKRNAPETLFKIIRAHSSRTKIILFTDDVHSKREQQIAEQHDKSAYYQHFKKRSIKFLKVEKKVYADCDQVCFSV